MIPCLYLIPSPLSVGTVQDVLPAKVIEIIDQLDHFIVEDLRTSRRFISSLHLSKTVADLHFELLNEHSSDMDLSRLLDPILKGFSVGLLSDAGMPCTADPGENLVALAHERGIRVVPLVGPSSLLLALVASGLNGENFAFNSYLPVQLPELVKQIKQLEQLSRSKKQSQLFIETPYRNNKLLACLLSTCSGSTRLCIAADITGESEFICTKSIDQWRKKVPELNKIPTIFILES